MKYNTKHKIHQDWELFKFIIKIILAMVIFFAVDYYVHNSNSNGDTMVMDAISKIITFIKNLM